MFLPVLLLFTATLAAAIAAYGTIPHWAALDNGLEIIEWSRRLQWPLVTLSILCCVAVLVLIIVGKRKPWWLIGIAPVVTLMMQLFVTGAMNDMSVADAPPFVAAADANFVADDEYVVGVHFGEHPYALPYRQLYRHPVVILVERERRAAVLFSPFANRATAFQVNRQVRARELDIVSMPANALLVYNVRIGEFINGVTGQTLKGTTPYGFTHRLQTRAMPFWQWRALNPGTRVTSLQTLSTALPTPALPHLPMRLAPEDQALKEEPVILLCSSPAVAIRESDVTTDLLNIEVNGVPLLIYRHEETGRLRVFERRFAERVSRFIANPSQRRAAKGVAMLDVATNSGWTEGGVAVDGEEEIIGQKLKPYTTFDEGQYYGVLRHWYPNLVLYSPEAATPRE